VREFCEFWRRKNLPDTAAAAADDDAASDESAPVVKVSKRKAEAKIREIAVYEFRPQCYKHKLWYVNDETIEKLNLSLPVPTEWKWITLTSTKSTTNNMAGAAKQSVSVSSVQPSPTTANSSIKSFMSSVMPIGSCQQSPAGNSVTTTKTSCGIGQSPSQGFQQSPSVSTSKVESVRSASPVCDNGVAAGAKDGRQNPVRPAGTPCSSSAVKKRKLQSVRRSSLPLKQQPCLLFSKKPQPPAAADDDDDCMVVDSCTSKADNVPTAAKSCVQSSNPGTVSGVKSAAQQPVGDNDCMIIDSCTIKADNMLTAAKPCVQPSNLGTVSGVKSAALQPIGDEDCMIVDSCVLDSEFGNKSDASKERAELREAVVGSVSDVYKISDVKSLPETDANCNVSVQSSVNDANMAVDVDD